MVMKYIIKESQYNFLIEAEQEDSGSRMSRIGKNEIVYGQVMGFDDILKAISRVNPSDVREIAGEYLTKSPTLALVGPFKNDAKFEKVLRS